MKKMLFIFPDYYDFDKVVAKGFEDFSEYSLTKINSAEKFRYKNFGEKFKNFIYKTFLNKNLKKEFIEKKLLKKINEDDCYDVTFINRPDILSNNILEIIKKKSKKTIVYYWDSFEKIKGLEETISYFDKKFSFDLDDCKKHNLSYINNFYFDTQQNNVVEYDIAYLGTYDKRHPDLLTFLKSNSSLSFKVTVYKNNKSILNEDNLPINYTNEIIPFTESTNFYKNCKTILDLAHSNQKGLSFRPFEAIGLKKKLITTNKDIVNYDFYRSENIYIINNLQETIPDSFFTTNYIDLPNELYEKYSLKNWVNTILQ